MNLVDYSNMYDYITIVEPEDDFLIEAKNVNADDIKIIFSMLKENNFEIKDSKVKNSKGHLLIEANKIDNKLTGLLKEVSF